MSRFKESIKQIGFHLGMGLSAASLFAIATIFGKPFQDQILKLNGHSGTERDWIGTIALGLVVGVVWQIWYIWFKYAEKAVVEALFKRKAESKADQKDFSFIVENTGGGIYKRIYENQKLLDLLQRDAPEVGKKYPWVTECLNSHNEFFQAVVEILGQGKDLGDQGKRLNPNAKYWLIWRYVAENQEQVPWIWEAPIDGDAMQQALIKKGVFIDSPEWNSLIDRDRVLIHDRWLKISECLSMQRE